MTHARPRYLEAKRSVDDRALSRRVRNRLLETLPADPRVLEVGCGTGVSVPRLRSWGVDAGQYRGVDTDEGVVAFARDVRPKTLRYADDGVEVGLAAPDADFTVADLSVRFEVGDALAALDDATDVDLVIAGAFADLVSLSRLVPAVGSALHPGGLAYFPITFDGGTIFGPALPGDDAVERAYHEAIDARSGRDVRAGRHLAERLNDRDGDLLAMASSDWVVRPHGSEYPADERHFLSRILGFVEEAVSAADRPVQGFDSWLATRREQLATGELFYVAHQYDLLYRSAER
ncbi:class I SAM-dependent methyltransferase [Halobellus marinus]|uniref:class I SAM-dependent methyltransferase n=1 Tax=Halobellus TaxID=1073986 RepID=UPI0028AECB1D|nr:class I SAM-dependent methyltransferase [Halobellus sp. DFY28]